MAQSAVIEAFEARLATWASAGECPVIEPNAGGLPEMGTAFVMLQFPVSNTMRHPVNEGVYREEGGARFVLHEERGRGIERPQRWGDELADLFRRKRFDGVVTLDPTSPFYDDSNDQGAYFQSSVVVPYWFNFRDENGEV